MEELRLNGKCLYTPGGSAREYAAVGCNFYRGCPYQCRYCFNRKGMTAKVMGVDHAVLDDCFTKEKNRPKKYRDLTGEEYALLVFKRELNNHLDYFRKTGIFFSFATDPLCQESAWLTTGAALYAVSNGVPVKILTKNANWPTNIAVLFESQKAENKRLIAFGFTLTGRDDWEPYASENQQRIEMLRELHEQGFKTFASIEPIIDFDSSLEMIKQSVRYCDQFLIGLMSSRQAYYRVLFTNFNCIYSHAVHQKGKYLLNGWIKKGMK